MLFLQTEERFLPWGKSPGEAVVETMGEVVAGLEQRSQGSDRK